MTKLEPGAAPLVAVIMGSKSDWTTMQRTARSACRTRGARAWT